MLITNTLPKHSDAKKSSEEGHEGLDDGKSEMGLTSFMQATSNQQERQEARHKQMRMQQDFRQQINHRAASSFYDNNRQAHEGRQPSRKNMTIAVDQTVDNISGLGMGEGDVEARSNHDTSPLNRTIGDQSFDLFAVTNNYLNQTQLSSNDPNVSQYNNQRYLDRINMVPSASRQDRGSFQFRSMAYPGIEASESGRKLTGNNGGTRAGRERANSRFSCSMAGSTLAFNNQANLIENSDIEIRFLKTNKLAPWKSQRDSGVINYMDKQLD
mmetsp:Transcript_17368/g.29212  ORF Transcript_17368/g.29212 Transcript_17368/m.29212 type:complete len:270 (+) Transcript_17368:1872-2681(+)